MGSKFEVGAIPMDPANAAARSDRISACYTAISLYYPEKEEGDIRPDY